MIKRIIRPLATFLIAFALLIIPFALEGLFPFGDRQIMIIDSWHQYYPILQTLHDKLINGKSLFYSWNTGGGTNFWLMMTYYAMSPLNLLSILVPKLHLREFLFFITLFKIALGGAFFTIYLQQIHKRYDMSTTFFGLLYAFCGFFISYYWNVMWLDVVAILPLIILGLRRLIFDNKILLYGISLAYAMISNYYMAYFVCFFIALYTVACVFGEGNFTLKNGVKRVFTVAGFSIIPSGMAAIVLLPVIKGMRLAYGLSSHNPTTYTTYTTLFDTINRFLPFIKPSIVDGLPNLALGIMGTLFFIIYFVQRDYQLKEKIAYGLLFVFLIISTNINYLNFIWHGLHFPNQVPYRFAFVISFLMLTLAYKGYLSLDKLPAKLFYQIVAATIFYLIIVEKIIDTKDFTNAAYGMMLLLVIYSAVLALYFKKKVNQRVIAQLLLLVFAVEAVVMAGLAVGNAHSSGRENYFASGEQVQGALSYLREHEDAVSRVELSPIYSANDPLLYQYMGISQFSSTANANYTTFTKMFGLSSNEPSNSYKYIPNTPIANGFLGVNYIVAKDEKLPVITNTYDAIYQTEAVRLLKTRYPLPFCFAVNRDVFLDVADAYSAFDRQQTWLEYATGEYGKVFTTIPINESTFDNLRLDDLNTIRYNYSNVDSSRGGRAKLVFEAPGGKQMYIYFKNQNKQVKVSYAGKNNTFDPRRGVVIDVGMPEAGTRIAVTFEVDAQKTGYFELHAVAFNDEVYQTAYNKLIQSPLNIEMFDDTQLAGSVNMSEEGVLYTSIPFDGGWRAIIDDEIAEVVPLKDAVMAFPLDAGEHTIKLSYTPPGFIIGRNISLLSLVVFIGLAFLIHNFSKKKTKLVTPSIEVSEIVKEADANKEPAIEKPSVKNNNFIYGKPQLDEGIPATISERIDLMKVQAHNKKENKKEHNSNAT